MMPDYKYYVVSKNRFWDILEARFVESIPAGESVVEASSEAELEEDLRFFGYPLGEFKNDADFAAEAREKRNALIAETDFLVMPDYPLDDEKKGAVLAYRQALRDVPEQAGFPRQIDWPVKP